VGSGEWGDGFKGKSKKEKGKRKKTEMGRKKLMADG